MRRNTLYISEPQHAQFQTMAKERGQAYSELIREALNQYLDKQIRARAKTARPHRGGRERA